MRAIVVLLIVLVAGILGLGIYRNWFTVTVNKDKIEADAHTVQEKFEGKAKEMKGTVTAVEAAEHRFTIATADDPGVTIVCTDTSTFRLNNEAGTFADLKDGDKVTVSYREKGGKREATSVTIGGK